MQTDLLNEFANTISRPDGARSLSVSQERVIQRVTLALLSLIYCFVPMYAILFDFSVGPVRRTNYRDHRKLRLHPRRGF